VLYIPTERSVHLRPRKNTRTVEWISMKFGNGEFVEPFKLWINKNHHWCFTRRTICISCRL